MECISNPPQFNLLSPYRDRILWGISVFHAYGHQWPCQLVYHPRKRTDFGFSDGEGCERFWSSISYLIRPLRVSNVSAKNAVVNSQLINSVSSSFICSGPQYTASIRPKYDECGVLVHEEGFQACTAHGNGSKWCSKFRSPIRGTERTVVASN
jgi:hypothetical protein